jgi:hypothetical protein
MRQVGAAPPNYAAAPDFGSCSATLLSRSAQQAQPLNRRAVRRLGRFVMRVLVAACLFILAAASGQSPQKMVVELNSVRLYLPDADLRERLGDDVSPLAAYIKVVEKETATFLGNAKQPNAKGLLIAVGVKPGKKAKVWCDAVDGQIPADTITSLQLKLSKLPTLAVKHGSIAFAIEMKLWGQKPDKFPEMPRAWREAAQKSKEPLLIPDGLFKILWPE